MDGFNAAFIALELLLDKNRFFFLQFSHAAIGKPPLFSVQAFNLRTLSSLCIMLLNLKPYLPFMTLKDIYLTIFVSLRHEHDVNQAAIMVVLI